MTQQLLTDCSVPAAAGSGSQPQTKQQQQQLQCRAVSFAAAVADGTARYGVSLLTTTLLLLLLQIRNFAQIQRHIRMFGGVATGVSIYSGGAACSACFSG